MTFEARLIIVLLYFALWGFLGLLPWTFAAVARRGREVLPALPIAVAAACLAGVLVPIVGARDETGFIVSIVTAFAGGVLGTAGGSALAVRLSAPAVGESTDDEGRAPRDAVRTPGYTDLAVWRIISLRRLIRAARAAAQPTSAVRRGEPLPPGWDPDLAIPHIDQLLSHQAVAWDGLDTKIAALLGFSGTVLSVLAAFLALRTQTLDAGMIVILSLNTAFFTIIALLALAAWRTRPFIIVTWQGLTNAMRRPPAKSGKLKWALFRGQAKAYDLNDAVITFKAMVADHLIVVFVLQALSLVAAIFYSAT